ncbi:MAG TPA: hypothetical protein VKY65_16675 [Alphaproteobacteria bacterium]|nr:hypothetical protein [Alphaproteobacteria bacterium]
MPGTDETRRSASERSPRAASCGVEEMDLVPGVWPTLLGILVFAGMIALFIALFQI